MGVILPFLCIAPEVIADDPGLRRGDDTAGLPPKDVIPAKAGIAGGSVTGARQMRNRFAYPVISRYPLPTCFPLLSCSRARPSQ